MTEAHCSGRRGLLVGAACCAAASFIPRLARARSDWPAHPIKLIVPFGPGAATDIVARSVAAKVSARLDQQFIVENKVGAGGMIGTTYVASQLADGYTLLLHTSPYMTAPLLLTSKNAASYDPTVDLRAIGEIGAGPFMIVVGNEVKARTLDELIALARANPNSISYGSAGVGTFNHLGGELLCQRANIKLLHVPYTGLGPAMTDLLGGRIQMLVASFPVALPQVHAGGVRALAVTGPQRSSLAPGVPTMVEAGVPDFKLEAWWGLLGPRALPEPIVSRLNQELNQVLATPEILNLLARNGATPRAGSPGQFSEVIRSEVLQWRTVIDNAHIVGA